MLPVKVFTRKRLIGSSTWCPAGVREGRGSQSWRETGINENSAGASVCYQPHLLHRWPTNGGQAPRKKHDKNTRMIKASRLNVYNAVLKSASRLSTYSEAYFACSKADGAWPGHRKAGTRNGTNATPLLCLRTKQEKWGFHHPGPGRECKHNCRTGKVPTRICSSTLHVKLPAEPRV